MKTLWSGLHIPYGSKTSSCARQVIRVRDVTDQNRGELNSHTAGMSIQDDSVSKGILSCQLNLDQIHPSTSTHTMPTNATPQSSSQHRPQGIILKEQLQLNILVFC
jgi:hypothetical protein